MTPELPEPDYTLLGYDERAAARELAKWRRRQVAQADRLRAIPDQKLTMTIPRRKGLGVAWSALLAVIDAYLHGDPTIVVELSTEIVR